MAAQRIDLHVFRESNQVKSHWTFSLQLCWKSLQKQQMCCKPFMEALLCYSQPVETVATLSPTIVMCDHRHTQTGELAAYSPLNGTLTVTWDDEKQPLKYSLKVSLCLEDTTCVYDIPPGYVPAFSRSDLWVGGCVALISLRGNLLRVQ